MLFDFVSSIMLDIHEHPRYFPSVAFFVDRALIVTRLICNYKNYLVLRRGMSARSGRTAQERYMGSALPHRFDLLCFFMFLPPYIHIYSFCWHVAFDLKGHWTHIPKIALTKHYRYSRDDSGPSGNTKIIINKMQSVKILKTTY